MQHQQQILFPMFLTELLTGWTPTRGIPTRDGEFNPCLWIYLWKVNHQHPPINSGCFISIVFFHIHNKRHESQTGERNRKLRPSRRWICESVGVYRPFGRLPLRKPALSTHSRSSWQGCENISFLMAHSCESLQCSLKKRWQCCHR